jgi:hypothetical protein
MPLRTRKRTRRAKPRRGVPITPARETAAATVRVNAFQSFAGGDMTITFTDNPIGVADTAGIEFSNGTGDHLAADVISIEGTTLRLHMLDDYEIDDYPTQLNIYEAAGISFASGKPLGANPLLIINI